MNIDQHIAELAQQFAAKGYTDLVSVFPSDPSLLGAASSDLSTALKASCHNFIMAGKPLPDHWFIDALLEPPPTGSRGQRYPREYLNCEFKVRYDETTGFSVEQSRIILRRDPQELAKRLHTDNASIPSHADALQLYQPPAHRFRKGQGL